MYILFLLYVGVIFIYENLLCGRQCMAFCVVVNIRHGQCLMGWSTKNIAQLITIGEKRSIRTFAHYSGFHIRRYVKRFNCS